MKLRSPVFFFLIFISPKVGPKFYALFSFIFLLKKGKLRS
jgi:hypothetical protein